MFKHDLVRLILATAEGSDGNGGGAGQTGGQTGGDTGQGGSGDGGDRGGAGGGNGTPSGGQSSGNAGSSTGGGGDNDTGKTGGKRKLEDLSADELIGLVREHRGEAAENRTKRTAAEQSLAELQRTVAAALGVDTDGNGKPDPDKLAADLAKAQDTARQRAVELAVYRAAGDSGADPAALLDSRSFLDSVADLDPASGDFTTRLGDKIATAAKDNPRLTAAGGTTGTRPGGGIGQGGRGPQSGPTGVAAGRALHPASKARQNANSTT